MASCWGMRPTEKLEVGVLVSYKSSSCLGQFEASFQRVKNVQQHCGEIVCGKPSGPRQSPANGRFTDSCCSTQPSFLFDLLSPISSPASSICASSIILSDSGEYPFPPKDWLPQVSGGQPSILTFPQDTTIRVPCNDGRIYPHTLAHRYTRLHARWRFPAMRLFFGLV